MHTILLLILGLLQAGSPDAFTVQADLQGRYAEISQASLQFVTDADVDDFHDVMYTSDWTVTDMAGQQQDWGQLRLQALHALTMPHPTAIVQSIQKLALVPNGAAAVVNVTTVRTVVDNEGRYGQKGATHTLSETTPIVTRGSPWRVDGSCGLVSRSPCRKSRSISRTTSLNPAEDTMASIERPVAEAFGTTR